MAIFVVGFGVICLGGACVVFAAGCGSKKKNVELIWDAGVTEFDLGPEHDSGLRSQHSKHTPNGAVKTSFMPEERILLLDDDDEEL